VVENLNYQKKVILEKKSFFTDSLEIIKEIKVIKV